MIKKLTIDEKEILFVCNSRNTRHGFAHDCELYINDCYRGSASCFYLNRTWESYRYQSVMKKAVYTIIDVFRADFETEYKNRNGYKKLTKERREAMEEELKRDNTYIFYKKIYDAL